MPPGPVLLEMKMGALVTIAGAGLAFLTARVLHVGRFGPWIGRATRSSARTSRRYVGSRSPTSSWSSSISSSSSWSGLNAGCAAGGVWACGRANETAGTLQSKYAQAAGSHRRDVRMLAAGLAASW